MPFGNSGGEASARAWEHLLPLLGPQTPIRLVWLERSATGGRLWSAEFACGDGHGGTPRALGDLQAPFLALASASAGEAVYTLQGPDAKGNYIVKRAALQGQTQESLVGTLPPLKPAARAWGLTVLPSGEVAVLAATGDNLMLATVPRDQTWTIVAQHVNQSGFLNVFPDSKGRLWAHWLDPGRGFKLLNFLGGNEGW